MSKGKQRIETGGGEALGNDAFGALSLSGLPSGSAEPVGSAKPAAKANKTRHRLDIKRVKSGRGGKTVTVISGFPSRDPNQLNPLAKRLKNACATGGAVKDGTIEIQGDLREKLCELLEAEGFRPVMAGG